MAFFASSKGPRTLKRTYSTDPQTSSSRRTDRVIAPTKNHTLPAASEFGLIVSDEDGGMSSGREALDGHANYEGNYGLFTSSLPISTSSYLSTASTSLVPPPSLQSASIRTTSSSSSLKKSMSVSGASKRGSPSVSPNPSLRSRGRERDKERERAALQEYENSLRSTNSHSPSPVPSNLGPGPSSSAGSLPQARNANARWRSSPDLTNKSAGSSSSSRTSPPLPHRSAGTSKSTASSSSPSLSSSASADPNATSLSASGSSAHSNHSHHTAYQGHTQSEHASASYSCSYRDHVEINRASPNASVSDTNMGYGASGASSRPPRSTRPPAPTPSIPSSSQSGPSPASVSAPASSTTSPVAPSSSSSPSYSPPYPPSTFTASTSTPSSYNATPTQDTYAWSTPRTVAFASSSASGHAPASASSSASSPPAPGTSSQRVTDAHYTTSPISLASSPSPLTPHNALFSRPQPSPRGSPSRRGDSHDRHSPLHQQQTSSSSASVGPRTGLNADRLAHGHGPRGYLSSGSASDTSYGSPLSELGYSMSSTMNMKRLLSKPAARPSTSGTMSISGPSDTEQMASAAAARRRVDTSPAVPGASFTSGTSPGMKGNGQSDVGAYGPRKTTTSNPEPPRSFSSLGRARGQEWGHVLARQIEIDRERERRIRGRHTDGEHDQLQHMRSHSSSFSLSSPSEGASPYPYGLALERKVSASAVLGGAGRSQIHLATSVARRLSVLGAREVTSPMSAGGEISPAAFRHPPSSAHSLNSESRNRPHHQQVPPQGQNQATRSRPNKDAGVSCRKDSPPPPGLTPAELVAHSYKQQERRREELVRGASRDVEHPERVKTSPQSTEPGEARGRGRQRPGARSERSGKVEEGLENEKDGGSTPYYTVFGNPSGRIVAIGNERDSAFGLFESDRKAKLNAKAVLAEVSGTASAKSPGTAEEGKQEAVTPAQPHTLRRKLSKKLSGKVKRDGSAVRGGGREKDKESKHSGEGKGGGEEVHGFGEESRGSFGARPSTANTSRSVGMEAFGRRSATLPRERPHTAGEGRPRRSSLKISMDGFVAVHHTELESGRALPSAGNGIPATSNAFAIPGTWNRDDQERAREKTGERERERVVSESGARIKTKVEKAANSPTSGKIWGLVKRISSTALKDKFSKGGAEESPPPVPALPRELLKVSLTRDESPQSKRSSEKSASPILATFRKACSSSQSTTARPSTAPALAGTTPTRAGSALTSPVEGRNGPSVTTRSSSPISSDISSNNYFKGTHSNRSSTSSYGELIQSQANNANRDPVNSYIGQPILSPEELHLLDQEHSKERKPVDNGFDDDAGLKEHAKEQVERMFSREWSSPAEFQGLPVPPRRTGGNGAKRGASSELQPPSPGIPTFSTDNAVNTFGFRAASRAPTSTLQSSDFGVLSPAPPPRPARSPRRSIPATSVFIETDREQPSTAPLPMTKPVLPEERAGRGSIGALSQASTARPSVSTRHDSIGDSRTLALSPTSSNTLTFRDLGSAPRQAWSDAEKTAKWEALLAKSDQAGGTLHVGFGGLLSDNIRDSLSVRDSTYSDF